MKLTTVLLIATMLQVSAAGFAQKITFVKKNATLKQIFREINKQTGYSVLISGTNVKVNQAIGADFADVALVDVLKKAFEKQQVEYTIEDKTIVIRDKETETVNKQVFATPKDTLFTVTGRVLNDENRPLAGASISVTTVNKANIRLSSNNDGSFKFSADKGSLLTITYIGYQLYRTNIKGANLGDIKLQSATSKLDEVKIIIGYGTTTKALTTGNVTVVNSAEIEKQPVSNVLQALQGRVPGLIVNQTSGFASAPISVKIRGQNSLAANISDGVNNLSEPLYILDGVPIVSAGSSSNLNVGINKNRITGPSGGQSPLYGINPSDIESISVLKDADATAIYGARGANGVILITTKKGKTGATTVTANVYTGISLQTRKLDLMNTAQYLEMRNVAFLNDNKTPTTGNAYDLKTFDQNRYTDWQKELLGTAHTSDAQLSLSGGDANTTFRISGGFNSASPPFKGDYKEQRASASLALTNVSFKNKLHTSATVNFSSTSSNLPSTDITKLIYLAPNAPSLLDANGNLNYAGWPSNTFPSDATSLKRVYSADTKNLISNLNIGYQIINGLDLNASLGYNISRQDQLQTAPSGSFNPAFNNSPFATFGNNNSQSWIIEPTLTYRKSIGKHNFNTLIGSTFQDTRIDGNSITGTGYTDDSFLSSMAAASGYSNPFTNFAETKFQSIYARVSYNYNEKYIINLNGRRDGSSRFATNKKFGNFGSVGAAWIFSREGLFSEVLNVVSFGKVRASFGLIGGDNLNDYQYLSSFSTGQYTYQGTTAFQLNRLANDQFSWTTNKKLEAAIALGFLNGRINTEFSLYRNRSGNQLISYPLPSLSGFSSVIENLPALIENKGFEITLQTQNIRSKNFSWSTDLNISRNQNKLLEFPGLASSSYANRYALGRSINSVGLYKFTGIDSKTGLYTFADVNDDGKVDLFGNTDYIYKDNTPSYYGGINNSLTYRGFQLSAFFTFTKQRGILRLSSVTPGALGSGLGNQLILSEQLSGKPALDNLTTDPYRSDRLAYYNSDATFVDASYIRLQNLSFAYNLPPELGNRIKLKNLKIYLQAQNLLTITGYKGTDPASPGSFSLPPRKIVTAGIQTTF